MMPKHTYQEPHVHLGPKDQITIVFTHPSEIGLVRTINGAHVKGMRLSKAGKVKINPARKVRLFRLHMSCGCKSQWTSDCQNSKDTFARPVGSQVYCFKHGDQKVTDVERDLKVHEGGNCYSNPTSDWEHRYLRNSIKF